MIYTAKIAILLTYCLFATKNLQDFLSTKIVECYHFLWNAVVV